ncbi:MAG: exodeoxyribonuclease VII large subunit [Firmicutes bacterium]|nr:exodeoxyribonuclease VII large subunit [Bacillota bacterium]
MKSVSVTQLNEYIAKKLREDYRLRNLAVEGEISGFSRSGRHYYLNLKDANSIIKCAIWDSNARNIDMSLVKNGEKIIAIGDISPYPKNGNYSFSIRQVESIGQGELMAEFNRIKAKLEKEGLFDQKYKKPIPEFPKCIGVVTSATGAAITDIREIVTAKNNYTDLLIFPTLVQGVGAPASIIDSIETANRVAKERRIDFLIVGRGGGPSEELVAFNDEGVARAIFASELPIISAVGHEIDFSISDFVADVRAATPTKAAELAVPDTNELYMEIEENLRRLHESASYKIKAERQLLDSRIQLLQSNMNNKTNQARAMVEKALISIRENDPRNIFSKGYSAVLDDNEIIVSSVDDVKEGETYKIKMRDGSFKAEVVSKERN